MIRPSTQVRKNVAILSPIDLSEFFRQHQELKDLRDQTVQAHNKLMDKAESDVEARLAKIDALIEKVKIPAKGDKPIAGVDYRIPADGKSVDHNKVVADVLKRIPPQNKVEAPTIDYKKVARIAAGLVAKPEVVKKEKIPTVKEILEAIRKTLRVEHIPGLANEIASYRNQLAGKKYGTTTFVRGGGSSGGGLSTTKVRDEVPNGSGTAFTLAHSPVASTLQLFRGGARQQVGVSKDYTISGTSITLATTLVTGEILLADYEY